MDEVQKALGVLMDYCSGRACDECKLKDFCGEEFQNWPCDWDLNNCGEDE